jgi:hypothetical protein
MKRNLLAVIVLLSILYGCSERNGNNDPLQSLEGTKWKLEGIVDETGTLQVLEPRDCKKCYTLTFESDTSYSTISSFEHIGSYKVDYTTLCIRILSFVGPKLPEQSKDGELYCKTFISAQSISFINKRLRLYYNENKNYLLFKSQQP